MGRPGGHSNRCFSRYFPPSDASLMSLVPLASGMSVVVPALVFLPSVALLLAVPMGIFAQLGCGVCVLV